MASDRMTMGDGEEKEGMWRVSFSLTLDHAMGFYSGKTIAPLLKTWPGGN